MQNPLFLSILEEIYGSSEVENSWSSVSEDDNDKKNNNQLLINLFFVDDILRSQTIVGAGGNILNVAFVNKSLVYLALLLAYNSTINT